MANGTQCGECTYSQLTLTPDAARKRVSKAIKTRYFRDSNFEPTQRPRISSPLSILRTARRAAARNPLAAHLNYLPTNVVTGGGGPCSCPPPSSSPLAKDSFCSRSTDPPSVTFRCGNGFCLPTAALFLGWTVIFDSHQIYNDQEIHGILSCG